MKKKIALAVFMWFCIALFCSCATETQNDTTSAADDSVNTEDAAVAASIDYTDLPEGEYTQYMTDLGDGKEALVLCGGPAMGLMTKYVFFSTDGGKDWGSGWDVSGVIHNYPVGAVFISSEIGFVITDYHGNYEFLYQTMDGGKTWTAVSIPVTQEPEYRYINGVSITYDDDILTVTLEKVGGETRVQETYISHDIGINWTKVDA